MTTMRHTQRERERASEREKTKRINIPLRLHKFRRYFKARKTNKSHLNSFRVSRIEFWYYFCIFINYADFEWCLCAVRARHAIHRFVIRNRAIFQMFLSLCVCVVFDLLLWWARLPLWLLCNAKKLDKIGVEKRRCWLYYCLQAKLW